MTVPWGWLPFTGVVCALCGMLATMLTQDIWSAHTSLTGREVVERLAVQVSEDFTTANTSFVQMQATCQALTRKLEEESCPPLVAPLRSQGVPGRPGAGARRTRLRLRR